MNDLLIFTKYPEPGKVKTRLAENLGKEEAARLYKKMAEHVFKNTKPLNGEYRQIICFDPPEKEDHFASWLPNCEMLPQTCGDLGKRMSEALIVTFKEDKAAVIIGTDCPGIDHALIMNAYDRLNSCDIVLGPAKDGGYYLIGCKKTYLELFQNIEWSTNRVLAQTLAVAKNLNLKVALLQELNDIDTVEDLCKLKNIM